VFSLLLGGGPGGAAVTGAITAAVADTSSGGGGGFAVVVAFRCRGASREMVMAVRGVVLAHLLMPPWRVRQVFSRAGVACDRSRHSRIVERLIRGEIRFTVEAALHPLAVWHKPDRRERAIEVFSQLRVWDTAQNNGVLIYLPTGRP